MVCWKEGRVKLFKLLKRSENLYRKSIWQSSACDSGSTMQKGFIVFIILAFALSAFGQQGDKPIKLQSDLVTVDITVTDKDGNFLRNLKAEDFVIYEDEKPQKLD